MYGNIVVYVIVRVYLSLSSRLRDLRERASSKERKYCNTKLFFSYTFLSINILDSSSKLNGILDTGPYLTGMPDADGEGVTSSTLTSHSRMHYTVC